MTIIELKNEFKLNERRYVMMKKIAFSTLLPLLLILSTSILAEAGTARFPVVVKWDASGDMQASSDIFLLNTKNTPVNVDLELFDNDGTKSSCAMMPTITIPGNGTHHISPSGCFAIAIGVPLNFDGIGMIKASSNSIRIYWRIYDETVSPHQLIDHGRETPK